MYTIHCLLIAPLILGGLFALPNSAHAAESYDNCAGFIDSLPATISTQGVWCLRKDLSTSITAGNAIEILTNNVTIDCNDFKIGGLSAGNNSSTVGIYATPRQNITVRNCGIRGFNRGIVLLYGAGHLIEDNRLDNNLYVGISVEASENSLIQRNRVYDTGGGTGGTTSYGIFAGGANVFNNTVSGVFASSGNTMTYGIMAYGDGLEIRDNEVREIMTLGTGTARGIQINDDDGTADGNRISNSTSVNGSGIYGVGDDTFCSRNTSVGFSAPYASCNHNYGNL